MNALTDNIYIQQYRQNHACSVNARIHQLCEHNPPQLAWAEPSIRFYQYQGHLRAGRHPSFISLVEGRPDWPDELMLSEVRLFWDDYAVHLLAIDSINCAEVKISEIDGNEVSKGTQVIKQTHNLLTLRDAARFGLTQMKLPLKLAAFEYHHKGRVVAWRLALPTHNGANNHV